MTQDYFKAETTKRYDIPLTHLDYGYIRDCTDVKELEKILRILRSGEEGSYPGLENEAEKRLETLNPKSRVLRKDSPALRSSDLDKSEQEDLKNDLETWRSDMEESQHIFGSTTTVSKGAVAPDLAFEDDGSLPPIRSGKVISVDGKVKETMSNESDVKKNKKVMPRSYKEWDKFDIDQELEKADEEPAKEKNPEPSTFRPDGIATKIDTQGMTDSERRAKAIREKDKGNEAFHAHDYEESILYYSRSLSIAPLAATYNNRALAYLRLSKWDEAITDCNNVLKLEPQNIKALLRRGTALKGKQDYAKARTDLDVVLQMEPNNKTAQDLIKEMDKLEQKASMERKEKGRRMVIEEVDGSDDDEEVSEEIVVEKPEETSPCLVNGHAEITKVDVVGSQTEASPPAVEPKHDSKEETRKDSETSRDDFQCKQGEAVLSDESDVNSTNQEPNLTPTKTLPVQDSMTKDIQREHICETKRQAEEGSGDSVQTQFSLAAEPSNTSNNESKKTEPESTEEAPESSTTSEEEEEEDGESEADVQHARPVFVQKQYPASEALLKEKGNSFFRAGQYPEAIEVYQKIIKALEKDPGQIVNLSLIYNNLATCYLKIGNCQAAIDDCNTSLSLLPHSVKPLLRRAAAYETLERYKQAYVDYRHILRIDSAVEQAQQGSTRCQKYLVNHYGHQWRHKLPPLVHVSQWDVPEIVEEGSKSETMSIPSPMNKPSDNTSSIPDKPSVVPEVQPQKQAAVEEAPKPKVPSPEEQFETAKAQGNKHVQKGEFELAVKCYCQCIQLFEDRAAVFTNRALCYLRLNKAQEAEKDCTAALSLDPQNCKAFYRRALARKAQKLYKDSLQDLLQLLRLETNNTAAKKEMEVVKGLYKQEYDKLKAQPAPTDKKKSAEPEKKKAAEPEKKRKRMKIEEIDEESDTEEKNTHPQNPSASRPKSSGATQKGPSPTGTPSHSVNGQKAMPSVPTVQSSPAADGKHTNSRAPESKKPGRAKSKKGGVKETSIGLPVTPPSAPKLQGKVTPFEFIQHWNSLKQAKEIQPYVQLLEQISPDDLPGVISNKLDGHMLQIITRCAAHDAQTGEVERAYSILCNIRQVPRFSTVVMFLSNKEKQDIRKVLESTSVLGTRGAEEIAAVRKDYGLK